MYEVTSYYNQFNMGYNGHSFDLNQFSMIGHPLNLMNNIVQPPTTPAMSMPMNVPGSMLRPPIPNGTTEIQRNNLGFQMNPVSKNKKK